MFKKKANYTIFRGEGLEEREKNLLAADFTDFRLKFKNSKPNQNC